MEWSEWFEIQLGVPAGWIADGDMWSDLMVATYRFPNFMPYDNYYYKNTNEGLFFEDLSSAWPNEQDPVVLRGCGRCQSGPGARRHWVRQHVVCANSPEHP